MCRSQKDGGRRCRGHYKQSLNFDKIRDNLANAQKYTSERSEKNKKRLAIKLAANNLSKLQNDSNYLDDSINQATEKLIKYGQEHGLAEFPELSMETKDVYSKEGIEGLLSKEELDTVMKNADSMSAFKKAYPDLYNELSTPTGTKTKVLMPDADTDEDYKKRYSRTVNFYAQDMRDCKETAQLVNTLMSQVNRKREVDKLVTEHKDVLSKALPDGDFVPYPSPIEGNTRGVRVYQSKKAPTAAQVRAWAKKQPNKEEAQKVLDSLKVKVVDSTKVRKKYPDVAEKLTHSKTKLIIDADEHIKDH